MQTLFALEFENKPAEISAWFEIIEDCPVE